MPAENVGWADGLGRCLAAWGALCALSAVGCGADDTEANKPPSEQCRDFVGSYCAKSVSCAQSTDRADFADLCEFSFQVYLPCERIGHVWKSTQSCLDEVAAISCSAVAPGSFPKSPNACQSLFGY